MADPSAVARLRANLDDEDASQAFLDAELAGFLDAAGGDLLAAERTALWQLQAGAIKQVDYTIGDYSEKASQRAAALAARIAVIDGAIARAATTSLARPLGTTSAPVRPGW